MPSYFKESVQCHGTKFTQIDLTNDGFEAVSYRYCGKAFSGIEPNPDMSHFSHA